MQTHKSTGKVNGETSSLSSVERRNNMNARERMRLKAWIVCYKMHFTKEQKARGLAERKHITQWMKQTGAYDW